jgi:hypothetical protein
MRAQRWIGIGLGVGAGAAAVYLLRRRRTRAGGGGSLALPVPAAQRLLERAAPLLRLPDAPEQPPEVLPTARGCAARSRDGSTLTGTESSTSSPRTRH